MLSFLQTWTVEIVVLLVLAMVIDIALPSTSLRRYVDYSISLVLLLLLLSPLLQLLEASPDTSSLLGAAQIRVSETYLSQDMLSQRSQWLAYRLILEESVERLAIDTSGVISCTARAEIEQNPASPNYGAPSYLELRMRVDSELEEEQRFYISESVKHQICTVFGLKQDMISIHIE